MILVLYEDDGPDGICGQSCEIMSSWFRLIEVADVDEAYHLTRLNARELCEKLGYCGINGSQGRSKARITRWFSDNKEDILYNGCSEIHSIKGR